jgi:hypothetical protein
MTLNSIIHGDVTDPSLISPTHGIDGVSKLPWLVTVLLRLMAQ